MLRSDRSTRPAPINVGGLILALVLSCALVWIVAFSAGRQEEHQHQQAVAADMGGSDHREPPQQADTDHAGVPAFAERFISNPEPSDGNDRERRDLAAQENTAAWAFWMALLSAAQLVLSGLGLIALLATIRQGRDAITKAGEANAISQQVAEADLRPYLFVDRLNLLDITHFTDKIEEDGETKEIPSGFHARVCIYLKNYGKVPARNIHVLQRACTARLYRGQVNKVRRS